MNIIPKIELGATCISKSRGVLVQTRTKAGVKQDSLPRFVFVLRDGRLPNMRVDLEMKKRQLYRTQWFLLSSEWFWIETRWETVGRQSVTPILKVFAYKQTQTTYIGSPVKFQTLFSSRQTPHCRALLTLSIPVHTAPHE